LDEAMTWDAMVWTITTLPFAIGILWGLSEGQR
jgi:hypothetical protein